MLDYVLSDDGGPSTDRYISTVQLYFETHISVFYCQTRQRHHTNNISERLSFGPHSIYWLGRPSSYSFEWRLQRSSALETELKQNVAPKTKGGETSHQTSLNLLEPSSVTMPSPSALFCLSNAFKSRTLWKGNSEVKSQHLMPHRSFFWYISTCKTASVLRDSWKSLHRVSLSGNQAFSGMKKKEGVKHPAQNRMWLQRVCKQTGAALSDLLNLHVASVQDGDPQFKGARHHGAQTTWKRNNAT